VATMVRRARNNLIKKMKNVTKKPTPISTNRMEEKNVNGSNNYK